MLGATPAAHRDLPAAFWPDGRGLVLRTVAGGQRGGCSRPTPPATGFEHAHARLPGFSTAPPPGPHPGAWHIDAPSSSRRSMTHHIVHLDSPRHLSPRAQPNFALQRSARVHLPRFLAGTTRRDRGLRRRHPYDDLAGRRSSAEPADYRASPPGMPVPGTPWLVRSSPHSRTTPSARRARRTTANMDLLPCPFVAHGLHCPEMEK